MKKFLSKNFILILSWVAVILWMVVIFFMSAQAADESAKLSKGLTKTLLTIVQRLFPNMITDEKVFHFVVRKIAHFSCYFILALLNMNALRRSGLEGFKCYFVSLAICVVYAATDEFHQTFVEGRVGNVVDVMIDSAGALTGLPAYLVVRKLETGLRKRKGLKADSVI